MVEMNASAGHRLGQIVGDWFEEYVVLPLIGKAARQLDLFIDSRFIERPARSGKIVWTDIDGNQVDYDFVLELGGGRDKLGIPVAFIESFWRRGARHSKDKARDDSGKLGPMRDTYPTARFLGMVAGGDFTLPARELVRSRQIELFYIPKDKIIQAFAEEGLTIDYPDRLPETDKAKIARDVTRRFTARKKKHVRDKLVELIGAVPINSFIERVHASLAALPQEIRVIVRHDSDPFRFDTVDAATKFLKAPKFEMTDPNESYVYQITYTDGSEFERNAGDVDELRELHNQIVTLVNHMTRLSDRERV
jgi:hypothetical protein